MNAGPDLDLAVAKACGIEVETRTFWSGFQQTTKGVFHHNGALAFRPSTDLSDAFLAAEKVGLFEECQLGRSGGEWDISQWMPEGSSLNPKPDFYHLACGPTPALGICAAILKFAENP